MKESLLKARYSPRDEKFGTGPYLMFANPEGRTAAFIGPDGFVANWILFPEDVAVAMPYLKRYAETGEVPALVVADVAETA